MSLISCNKSVGTGRAIVLIQTMDRSSMSGDQQLTEDLVSELSDAGTVHLLQVPELQHSHVAACTTDLLELLVELKVRQASFITLGRSSILLWKLAVTHQRLVRNALIINGEIRPKASWFEGVLQQLESFLPLGLPFRVHEGKFYALPFLERFRFPAIVVTLKDAAQYVRTEAEVLAKALPVAWSMEIDVTNPATALIEAFHRLKAIPPKRPQKRRKREAAA